VRFLVKVIWEDFVWFILIFHLSHHSCRRSRCYWSCWDASAGSLFVARRAMSSENVATVVLLVVGKSAVYSRYNNGPCTLPCEVRNKTVLMPVTGRGGRQGFKTSRISYFLDSRLRDGVEVVSFTHPPEIFLVLISVRG
jgi:hypothetical protein